MQINLGDNLHSIYGCVASGILHANKQGYILKIYSNTFYFFMYAVISIYFHIRYGAVIFPPPCLYKRFLQGNKSMFISNPFTIKLWWIQTLNSSILNWKMMLIIPN